MTNNIDTLAVHDESLEELQAGRMCYCSNYCGVSDETLDAPVEAGGGHLCGYPCTISDEALDIEIKAVGNCCSVPCRCFAPEEAREETGGTRI